MGSVRCGGQHTFYIVDISRTHMLCSTCHKHENDTATAPCGFCESIAFPEHVLCELTRGAQEKLKRFRCDAFRAKLSLVGEGRKKLNEAEPDNVLGVAQKYRLAVALQQLQKNPDEIRHALKYQEGAWGQIFILTFQPVEWVSTLI